jgi:hypothetical protein
MSILKEVSPAFFREWGVAGPLSEKPPSKSWFCPVGIAQSVAMRVCEGREAEGLVVRGAPTEVGDGTQTVSF